MGIINPNSLLSTTPTIPKFYWDVKSQEQRIKVMCCLIQQLIDQYGSTDSQISQNTEAIKELQELFRKFQESGFDEYYEQQVIQWISDNIAILYQQLAKQVFFGLTSDGYFCAYVPDSWSEITFDTGAVYGTEAYGRLILRFDADGHGIIDNEHDTSALTDTIDARIKSAAGVGLEYDDAKFKLNCVDADEITKGISKLTHDVSNDDSEARAITSDGVYKYAPSKAQTTDQPTDLTCTQFADGIRVTITSVYRSGKVAMLKLKIDIDDGYSIKPNETICVLPNWAKNGYGLSIGIRIIGFLLDAYGRLTSNSTINGSISVFPYMFVTYKE